MVKSVATVLGVLLLVGCSLSQPTPLPVGLSGMVIDPENADACVAGATITIVAGQAVGQSQVQPPCDPWGYDNGFYFKNLTPNVALTLRVTATGFQTKEVSTVPASGTLVIQLQKAQ